MSRLQEALKKPGQSNQEDKTPDFPFKSTDEWMRAEETTPVKPEPITNNPEQVLSGESQVQTKPPLSLDFQKPPDSKAPSPPEPIVPSSTEAIGESTKKQSAAKPIKPRRNLKLLLFVVTGIGAAYYYWQSTFAPIAAPAISRPPVPMLLPKTTPPPQGKTGQSPEPRVQTPVQPPATPASQAGKGDSPGAIKEEIHPSSPTPPLAEEGAKNSLSQASESPPPLSQREQNARQPALSPFKGKVGMGMEIDRHVKTHSPAPHLRTPSDGHHSTGAEKSTGKQKPDKLQHAKIPFIHLEKPVKKGAVSTNETHIASTSAPSLDGGIKIYRSTGEPGLDPLLTHAYQAFMSGDMDQAKTDYQKALHQAPDSLDAPLGLAAIAANRGQTQEAITQYQRVLELDPQNAAAQTGLIVLRGDSDPVVNESALKILLAKNPAAGFLHFALGNLYARQSRWPEAQEAYYNAFHTASDNADYVFNLAVSLDHLDQIKPALAHYRQALSLGKKQRTGFDNEQLKKRIDELQSH